MISRWQDDFRQLGLTSVLAVGTILADSGNYAKSQIIPDETLGTESSLVTPNTNINNFPADQVDGGAIRGANLFHSFREFNIAESQRVFFTSPTGIENIFSRVTGTNSSKIMGTLGVNGAANLFLLNPNGIIFGPNAKLDLRGSFLGTSASSIKFADGVEFSATKPSGSDLLTLNVPIGLQYGQVAGRILVQGQGNELKIDPNTGKILEVLQTGGLKVQPGQTLALLGGEVVLEGGSLNAESGQIALWSMQGEGVVTLTPTGSGWRFSSEGVQNFQNILLLQAAALNISGANGGNIQIQGRQVKVQDGSFILSLTQGQTSGGTIDIRASESIEASGNAPSNGEASVVLTETKDVGRAGDVVINTAKLILRDGAQISSGTFSQGNGGSIIVNASESVEATGIDRNGNFASGLFASTQSSGNGGIVEVTTGRLILRDGGKLGATTFSDGQGGKVFANVSGLIEATGIEPQSEILRPSGLFASSVGKGDGGTITINANKLLLQEGAEVSVTSFKEGSGGKAFINTLESVEVVGFGSGLKAATVTTGEGGTIEVITGRLIIGQGASIATTSFEQGRGGNVFINASDSVEVMGGGRLTAQAEGTGDSGTVTVKTRRFVAQNGANILAAAFADGNGGSINIEASDIELMGVANNGLPTILFAATRGNGDGGEINIKTDRLIVRDGAQLGAGTFSSGQGGNVFIEASESIELIGAVPQIPNRPFFRDQSGQKFPSGLFTGSQGTGNAGNLTVKAQRLILRDGAEISVNNQGIGDAGNLEVTARNLSLDNQAVLSATTTSGQGGNMTLKIDDVLLLRRNSQISTTAGIDRSGGDGGNISIDSTFIIATPNENSDITANAFQGRGGNININAVSIFGLAQRPSTPPNNTNDIDASSQFGLTGNITINTPDVDPSSGLVQLPNSFTDASQQIVSSCNPGSAARRSSFTVTGRGGIARSPIEPFQSEVSTARWITLDTINTEQSSNVIDKSSQSSPDKIVEAQGWIFDKKGNVSLVAQIPNINTRGLSVSSGVCSTK